MDWLIGVWTDGWMDWLIGVLTNGWMDGLVDWCVD